MSVAKQRFSRSLCVCSLLLAALTQAAEWEKLPPMPEPNGGFIGGVVDGKILIIGGTNWEGGQKNWLANIQVFDPAKLTWSKQGALDSPVAYAVVARTHAGVLGFAGGTTGSKPFSQQVWLAPSENAETLPGLPDGEARSLAAGGWLGGKWVFVGGTDDPANIAGFKRTAVALDRAGKLTKLPDYPGKGFGTAASAIAGDELFVFGGANWTGTNQDVANIADAYAFSAKTGQWRKLRPYPFPARGLTAVTVAENLIYLAGGYKSDAEGFADQAFLYDVRQDTYTPAPPVPYKAMPGLLVCGDFVYCLGGEDKPKSRTNACYRIRTAELLK